MSRLISCRECGKALNNADRRAEFCGSPCRKTWNNRRMVRGAELYDLMMALRFNRAEAKAQNVWSLMCRLASVWMEEDKAAGRTTFKPPGEVKDRMTRYLGVIVQRGKGSRADGRK